MIINIRGTSGAGKSTIVNNVTDAFPILEPVLTPGRKRPLYYLCRLAPGEFPTLAIVGSYESPCGGCDTIKTKAEAFELIKALYGKVAQHVLFEGLLISEDTGYTLDLDGVFPDDLLVALINLPVEECVASVNARRAAKRGPDAPGVNPENTTRRHAVIARAVDKLHEAGVPTFTGSRAEVEALVLEKVLAL